MTLNVTRKKTVIILTNKKIVTIIYFSEWNSTTAEVRVLVDRF